MRAAFMILAFKQCDGFELQANKGSYSTVNKATTTSEATSTKVGQIHAQT